LNRSISYPFNSAALQEKAYLIGSQGSKSTAAFIRGSQSKNLPLLEHALELNPILDYYSPAPLKVNEKADIILAMSKLRLKDSPRKSISLLKTLKNDTPFLPLPIKNQILRNTSSAYQNLGLKFRDSAHYFLKKVQRVSKVESDTLRFNNENTQWGEATNKDKEEIGYLALAMAAGLITIYLSILFFRSFEREPD
jgi:hypothetical protein